jgi:hypothetical protein
MISSRRDRLRPTSRSHLRGSFTFIFAVTSVSFRETFIGPSTDGLRFLSCYVIFLASDSTETDRPRN